MERHLSIVNLSGAMDAAAAARLPLRIAAIHWLRKTHGWIGLWGATLGLIFGLSGIWLNHRAVLKLPPVAQQRSNTQLALPDPAPASAEALGHWLQGALQLDAGPISVKVEPAKPLAWVERGERDASEDSASAQLMQPERWTITFGGPQSSLQAETWAGNRSVSVRRIDNGLLGTLMNMHKGVGMPLAWILLVDTLAGSLILLSLSGLALWMLTHRRRVIGVAIFGGSLAVVAGVAASRL